MTLSYIPPDEILSPRRNWTLIEVLVDMGEDNIALSIGRWDGNKVLAMRWNGTADRRIGNPQSRGMGTWFVVPDEYREAILKSAQEKNQLAPNKLEIATAFFRKQNEEAAFKNATG